MADRNVKVVLSAQVSQYVAGMKAAQTATQASASEAEKAAAKYKAQAQVMESVGRGLTVVGAAAAVAVAAVVKTTAEFSAKMAQLKTVSKASSAEMAQLTKAALESGTAFGYTASQVADAQIELAKAGISAKQQLGGALSGALALAAAGQLDVGEATSIAVTAITQFNKTAADVPHIADLLASGADKSTASVQSIGEALKQSGLVAAQFGLSVEDTVGTLTAFAQAGLQGSDAGTSLKTMLLALATPSEQASKQMEALGVNAYDAQGNFVGITQLADNLRSGLSKLTPEARQSAEGIIFGSDAIRSAGILYDLGGKKLQGFIDANNEAGFASAQAAGKLDSLTGDVQKFNAVIQSDMIKAGSGLEGALRGVIQEATSVATAFGNLPGPIQNIAVVTTGLVAGIGLLGGAFLIAAPKVLAFKLQLDALGVSGARAAGIFGRGAGVAVALTAIASGLANTGVAGVASSEQINKAAGALKNLNDIDKLFPDDAFVGVIGAGEALKASFGGFTENSSAAYKFIDGLTFGLTHFSDTFKKNEGQFAAIGEQLKGLSQQNYDQGAASFGRLVQQLGGGNEVAKQALQAMPAYRDAIISLLSTTGQAVNEQNILAAATGNGGVASKIREAQSAAAANESALQAMSGAASDARFDIDALAKQIEGFGSVTLDARGAQRQFEQAVDDAAEAAKKNGRNLDIATEAGRSNQASLDAIASSATEVAAKLLKSGGSADEAAGAIRAGRVAFINAAKAMGMSTKAAEDLADHLQLIPKNVKTTLTLQGAAAARSAIADVSARLAALNGRTANVAVRYTQTGQNLATGGVRFAAGGAVNGSGPIGVDSVPAVLAPGEHVLTARDVKKLGGQAAVYQLRAGLNSYAKGGSVSATEKELAAAQRMEKAAQKTYDGISARKADEARKKAAKIRLEKAKDKVEAVEKKLGRAKEAAEKRENIARAREDFVSSERRGVSDPLSYVDQLRSMSRDDNYTAKQRAKFKDAANSLERQLVNLAKKSEDASEKLGDLKSSADSIRSSITSAIAGEYKAGDAGSMSVASGSFSRNGIDFTSYSSGTSAASLASYYAQGAMDTSSFASQLQQLATRGVDGRLLAEIAGYGVKEGAPIAAALLSASTDQISSINASYSAIQGNAATAAAGVTDYNYKAAIDAAQAVADKIAGQIAADSAKLRKVIADAFGLKGYASGTDYATTGLHLVGEQGPELVRFNRPGATVFNAGKTTTWMRGRSSSGVGNMGGGTVQPSQVQFHFTDDGSRLGVAMREIAERAIAVDQANDAVLMFGGAA